jgi:CheY-like chemotaxis protein
LGIGLTLARMMIERHGGTVTARSAGTGRGSTFVIELPTADVPEPDVPRPVAPSDAHALQATAAGSAAPRTRRVVVADDNADSAETLAMLLRMRGCEVETAYDGDAAVAVVAAHRPDAVFLDIGMPGRSGYDACRAIRTMPDGASMLIVALTGWGQAQDRERSRAAGFDVHLVKPVDDDTLMALLRGPDAVDGHAERTGQT